MTNTNSQSQQEVNDILLSIRQMISEEEEAQRASSKIEPVDKGQNKILDLTKLVQDDGSVIELPSTSNKMTPQTSGTHSTDSEQTLKSSSPQDLSKQELSSMNLTEKVNIHTSNPQTLPLNSKTSVSQPHLPKSQASPLLNNSVGHAQDDALVSSTPFNQDNFLSDRTMQESAAAFEALSRATQHHLSSSNNVVPPTAATLSHYTVDDLMRELLKPLLKDWLDTHLPSLVKSLVLEQIEKVSQQPKTAKTT